MTRTCQTIDHDPIGRAIAAGKAMALLHVRQGELADERAIAVQEAVAGGMCKAEVARRLGVTGPVVDKLVARNTAASKEKN